MVAISLLGLFWKRANTAGAYALLISSVALSFVFWTLANPAALGGVGAGLLGLFGLEALDLPFVIRIWIVFLAYLVIGVAVSLATPAPRSDRPVELGGVAFATGAVFNIAAILVAAVLALLYVLFW